ncbi:MAG: hypothetical protein WCP79_00620 [Bacillota bacterium]
MSEMMIQESGMNFKLDSDFGFNIEQSELYISLKHNNGIKINEKFQKRFNGIRKAFGLEQVQVINEARARTRGWIA